MGRIRLAGVVLGAAGLLIPTTGSAQQPKAAAPAQVGVAAPKPIRGTDPIATFGGHSSAVTSLTFSPDGRQVISVSLSELKVWDASSGKEVQSLSDLGGSVTALSADGRLLAVADGETVLIHDLSGRQKPRAIDAHVPAEKRFPFRPVLTSLAFSPDGRRLATAGSIARVGGGHGYPGGMVMLWDTTTGKELHRSAVLSTTPCTVSFSPDGERFAAGTLGAGGELAEPGEIWVWDAQNGKVALTLKVSEETKAGELMSASAIAFSPDGKTIAVANSGGGQGKPAGLLIAESASTIQIWDLETQRELLSLFGHATTIAHLAFSPDGQKVAAAGGDRRVRVWSTTSGQQIQTLTFETPNIDALAFSPDGQRIAAAGAGTGAEQGKRGQIRVWALEKGSRPITARPDR